MATINISTVTPRVAGYARGCPNAIIERALMDAVIDICEITSCWRVVTTISTVAGTYEYTFPSLPLNTEIAYPITNAIGSGYLNVASNEYIQAFYPTWPDTTTDLRGEPRYLSFVTPTKGWLAPVPDAVYSLKFIIAIKPTRAATQMEELILNENMDAIVHMAIHKLKAQKGYGWSDEKDAIYHGKMGRYYTTRIRAKMNKGMTKADLVATARPFA